MNISFELAAPQMPNEIGIKMPIGKRQNGFKAPVIDIKDLTPEQAEQYAELMKQTFLAHYNQALANASAAAFSIRKAIFE